MRIFRRLSAAFTAAVVIVSLSGAASPTFQWYDGRPLTVNAEPVGANRATFEATDGDRLSVVLRRGTLATDSGAGLRVLAPDGTPIGEPYSLSGDVVVAHVNAWATGRHTVEVVSPGAGTGTLQLVGASRRTTTLNGPELTLPIKRPGERVFVTFAATAGQRFSLAVKTGDPIDWWRLALDVLEPGGRSLGTIEAPPLDADEMTRNFTAPATGTYALELSGRDDTTGTLTVVLTAPGAPRPVTVTGPDTQLTFTRPGEQALLAVAARHRPRLHLTELGRRAPLLRGGPVHHADRGRSNHRDHSRYDGRLPTHGDYRVQVVGSSTVTATVGGPAVTARTPAPGGRAVVSFDVTAGQWLDVVVRPEQVPDLGVSLTVLPPDDTDGRGLRDSISSITEDGETITFTAQTSGTYLLEVDPDEDRGGSVSVQIKRH